VLFGNEVLQKAPTDMASSSRQNYGRPKHPLIFPVCGESGIVGICSLNFEWIMGIVSAIRDERDPVPSSDEKTPDSRWDDEKFVVSTAERY